MQHVWTTWKRARTGSEEGLKKKRNGKRLEGTCNKRERDTRAVSDSAL
jgi:hypothetical protein